jgi:hypothetical protein
MPPLPAAGTPNSNGFPISRFPPRSRPATGECRFFDAVPVRAGAPVEDRCTMPRYIPCCKPNGTAPAVHARPCRGSLWLPAWANGSICHTRRRAVQRSQRRDHDSPISVRSRPCFSVPPCLRGYKSSAGRLTARRLVFADLRRIHVDRGAEPLIARAVCSKK